MSLLTLCIPRMAQMSVKLRGQNLYIYFRCYLPSGRKALCAESTGLKDNEKNRKIAQDKDKAIAYHLKTGRFDYLAFFPEGSKSKYFKKPQSDYVFSEWWDKWLEEKTI